ncbi:MAG: YgfZ/GcvT domain-containing protein [Gammaproteobacteria bacterium]
MDPHWQQILLTAGGRFADGELLHFGHPEAELSAALHTEVCTDLSHLGLIEVIGNDAGTFLHALLTIDVHAIGDGQSGIGAWCTAKGQVVTVLRVVHTGDRYLLLLPADLTDTVLRRLQLYVLRREVTLEDRRAALCRMGIAGAGLAPLFDAEHLPLPSAEGHAAQEDGLITIRLVGQPPRAIVLAEGEILQGLWQRLSRRVAPVTPQAWIMLDILAGVPWLNRSSSEKYLPQMLNLQCLGGVSFNKGCYPGQEVIARLKYRGQLKRRLHLALAETRALAEPGSAVYDDTDAIGEVLIASPHPQGTVLLAILPLAYGEQGEVFLQRPGGIELRLQDLPYAFKE